MSAISHFPSPSYVELAERHGSSRLSGLLDDLLCLTSVWREHV
jgi:hypothetical protein